MSGYQINVFHPIVGVGKTVMFKAKKKKINVFNFLMAGAGLFFLTSFLYSCFYVPKDENDFIRKIEQSFADTGKTEILVKDITNFEWDTVCFVTDNFADKVMLSHLSEFFYNSLQQEASHYFKEHYDVVKGSMAKFGTPSFKGAHLFLLNGKVVRTYLYNSNGFRFRQSKLAAYHMIYKDGEWLSLIETGIEDYPCKPYEVATFKAVTVRNNYSEIVLSELSK